MTMKREISFEIGRTYYTRNGRAVEYLAATTDGQHVVAELHKVETYDGEETARGDAVFQAELFKKPPVALRSEEIAAAEAKVRELEKRKAELYSECVNAEREVKGRLEKLRKFAGLERLEDFIEGRITHVLVESYGEDIYTVSPLDTLQQMESSYSRKPEGIKLISLFGTTNGDLAWRHNQWRDESGTWRMLVPCCSEDDAIAKRREMILADLGTHWATYTPANSYLFVRFAKAALAMGHKLTTEQLAAYREQTDRIFETNKAALEKTLKGAQEKLSEFIAQAEDARP